MNFMEIVESHPDVPGFQTFLLILCKEDHFGLQRDSPFSGSLLPLMERRYAEAFGKNVRIILIDNRTNIIFPAILLIECKIANCIFNQ